LVSTGQFQQAPWAVAECLTWNQVRPPALFVSYVPAESRPRESEVIPLIELTRSLARRCRIVLRRSLI
jgi:hypothetical protein